MLDYLKSIDTQLFLFLNGKHNEFFDFVMYWFSDKYIWYPLYAFLLFLVIKKYRTNSWYIILAVIAVLILSDQISSHLLKSMIQRPRPCHEASLAGMVRTLGNGCGGAYSFVSSHAANSFAIATFLILIIGKYYRFFTPLILIWAIIVSYSRIYLGVHYPGDVLFGAILGIIIGIGIAKLYFYLINKKLNSIEN
ncbi:MAG: phosphatase PAP2 family protein [Bacteroidetes bacterium]|nr:phosphatase PAP2 family protein [Bacteroidota bacterium]